MDPNWHTPEGGVHANAGNICEVTVFGKVALSACSTCRFICSVLMVLPSYVAIAKIMPGTAVFFLHTKTIPNKLSAILKCTCKVV